MVFKKILSGLCSAIVVLSIFSTTAGSKASFTVNENETFKKVTDRTVPYLDKINVQFGGTKEIHPEEFKASYTTVNYRSLVGEEAHVSVSGSNLIVDAVPGVDFEFSVIEYYTGKVVASSEGVGSVTLECASKMKENVVYYIEATINYAVYPYFDDALLLSVDNHNNLYFVKSPVYDYNVEKFDLLKTDDEFLKACKAPTKDMEADNFDIIEFSNDLCAGAHTDYEKVSRIYSFIVDEMYYDYDMAYGPDGEYQDDALSLIRKKIAVCEGFSNVFVALCRAQGIPATETYGFACGYDEMWAKNMTKLEYSNHAWVVALINNQWYILDPTWDNANEYYQGQTYDGDSTKNYIFIPLESFSFTHIILNVDVAHPIVESGSCGKDATYTIDENGLCTIYGSGAINFPTEEMDFFKVVFDKDSNITELTDECFVNCDLVDTIILPDTIERIGDYAFYHCENLEYVNIPESCEYIGDYAFWVCDKLAYIEIPDNAEVGYCTFELCPRVVVSVAYDGQVDFTGYRFDIAQVIVR